jgi:hypothetical protein
VAGGWRRLHNEELHNLYASAIKEYEMALQVALTHGRDKKCVQNFGRKPQGKRPLIRPRRRYEDIIKMKHGCKCVE